MEKNLTV